MRDKRTAIRRQNWNLRRKDLPIAISVLALLISLFGYVDEYEANRVAVASAEDMYATPVGFWLTVPSAPHGLAETAVENGGALPIRVCKLWFWRRLRFQMYLDTISR